jgi:hemoglobin-like flavoprotein
MTPEQITLVQQSFAVLLPRREELVTRMYDRLFELDPSLRTMFAPDMAGQKAKLSVALTTVVHGLRFPARIIPVLLELGRRHVGYAVRPEHYDTVGTALLHALGGVLGMESDDEVMVAWAAAYGLVASTMQEGAAAGGVGRAA